ncbi:hypothetical protein UFOVP1305_57 [uncultured Caudovirales phage]|uniref:Major capsid protein GpE n=1 Tax=uncultured Caudovirales phage TaxID=2100421 RepID=A0A6J5RX70_9CAUD|nr:hypothetical protein UFOVP896_2 [uncultured Caudovirales phage]CAB4198191.1 hypothetical protein UFOVP1305_57 [uncultured Caudovirales phage]
MPLPSPGDVHVDTLLTGVSVAYMNSATSFIADQVFPRVPVQQRSGKYATYSKADFLRDEMKFRAPGSISAGGGFRTSTANYYADVFGFHVDVDDQTVANATVPFEPVRDATQYVTQKELIKREVEFASKFLVTSVWTGGKKASGTAGDLVAGTDFTAWDDASSTPIDDIQNQAAEVEAATGILPNTLVINRRVAMALRNHPDIVDRIKYVSGNPVGEDMIARLVGVDRILVAAGVKNSADEGLANSSDYIAGNNALLVYSAQSPSLMNPSGGYTFVWSGYTGAQDGRRIKRYRLEEYASDRIEIEASWDMKLVAADVGAFFSACVS